MSHRELRSKSIGQDADSTTNLYNAFGHVLSGDDWIDWLIIFNDSASDFSEVLRILGFPRLVSIENFRNPNFPLVAEVLSWLVARFDPDAEVSNDIETEQDRVIFIKTIAQILVGTSSLKGDSPLLISLINHHLGNEGKPAIEHKEALHGRWSCCSRDAQSDHHSL